MTAQSRQKSHSNKKRRDLTFSVRDHVFLKALPAKGVVRFRIQGKLSFRFIGPYEVLERIGPMAYLLALPPKLAGVHDVFHVSLLRKYIHDPARIINYPSLDLQKDLSYDEYPWEIINRQERKFRNYSIPYVKVLWTNHGGIKCPNSR